MNECQWPTTCVLTAQVMLDEISQRAASAPAGEIDEDVRIRILDRAYQCTSPWLRNVKKKHVCDVTAPLATEELRGIWDGTAPDHVATHADKPAHWLTIAQELESFPSGA